MTGKQKLYFLLDAIYDAKVIAPSGSPLIIDPMEDLKDNIRKVELSQLFTKLEKDEQVLKVLQIPSRIKTIDIVEDLDPYDQPYQNDDGCWHIELLPAFDNYFLKIQQEPEYQEFTGKKPSTTSIQDNAQPNRKALKKIAVDEWLATKDRWTLKKIWQVVSALNAEWQLWDENTFNIPHDKFERARVDRKNDLLPILTNLHKKGFIFISKKIAETPPSKDPNKPQGSLWQVLDADPSIVWNGNTQVEIFPEQFTYLRDALAKLVSKPQIEIADDNKQYEDKKKVKWPDDFRWEGKDFVFGKYGSIGFISSDRKHILKTLTDKKGGWATINELQGNKDAGYVRSTIKQIEDRLPKEAKKHIKIVSTQDDDSIEKPNAGAYRIKVQP